MPKKIKNALSTKKRLDQQKVLNDYLMRAIALIIEKALNKSVSVPPFYRVTVVRDRNVKKLRIFRKKEGQPGFIAHFVFTRFPDANNEYTYQSLECSKHLKLEDDSDFADWMKHVEHVLLDLFDGFQITETK